MALSVQKALQRPTKVDPAQKPGQRGRPVALVSPGTDQDDFDARKSARLTLGTLSRPKKPLACVNLDALGSAALEDGQLAQTTETLSTVCSSRSLAGLALRPSCSTSPRQVEKLLKTVLEPSL